MKGIILAGGMGTRLNDLTRVTNKHLLSIYDKPMIFYPIIRLRECGITDIMIVIGGQALGHFIQLLGSGKHLGVNLTYRIQDEPDGIAGALRLCKTFVGGEDCCVILGDNIFVDGLDQCVYYWENNDYDAQIQYVTVSDPERYGVAELDSTGKVISLEEKPTCPRSNTIATGIYIYNPNVFDIIKTLKKSGRGEFEITDVNNVFLQKGKLGAAYLSSYWIDAGTIESLAEASEFMRRSHT